MVGGLGKRYTIYFPDGSVEQWTMLGPATEPGETLKLNGVRWRVVRAVELADEELDYELQVEAIEE